MGTDDESKIDHRARLTKIIIREALLELLGDKPIGAITVAEVSRAAGISRSTFYAHYATPEAVLDEIQDQLIEEMRPYNVPSGLSVYEAMLGVLQANKRNKSFWMLVVNDLSAWMKLAAKMVDLLTEFASPEEFPEQPTPEQSMKRLKERAVISGSAGIVMDWMRRGMMEPPELVAEAVADFVSSLDTPIGGVEPESANAE